MQKSGKKEFSARHSTYGVESDETSSSNPTTPASQPCLELYAVAATLASMRPQPVPRSAAPTSRPPREPLRRRSASRLAGGCVERSALCVASLTTWCFLQRRRRRRRGFCSLPPFWVGRCGRILAVSACGLPQLSTVGRGGRERERP